MPGCVSSAGYVPCSATVRFAGMGSADDFLGIAVVVPEVRLHPDVAANIRRGRVYPLERSRCQRPFSPTTVEVPTVLPSFPLAESGQLRRHHLPPCACTSRTVFRAPPRNSAESAPTPSGDTPCPRIFPRRRLLECPGHCRHANKFSSARRCTACFSGSACLSFSRLINFQRTAGRPPASGKPIRPNRRTASACPCRTG